MMDPLLTVASIAVVIVFEVLAGRAIKRRFDRRTRLARYLDRLQADLARRTRKADGFTLAELLICLSLVAIVTAVLVASLQATCGFAAR